MASLSSSSFSYLKNPYIDEFGNRALTSLTEEKNSCLLKHMPLPKEREREPPFAYSLSPPPSLTSTAVTKTEEAVVVVTMPPPTTTAASCLETSFSPRRTGNKLADSENGDSYIRSHYVNMRPNRYTLTVLPEEKNYLSHLPPPPSSAMAVVMPTKTTSTILTPRNNYCLGTSFSSTSLNRPSPLSSNNNNNTISEYGFSSSTPLSVNNKSSLQSDYLDMRPICTTTTTVSPPPIAFFVTPTNTFSRRDIDDGGGGYVQIQHPMLTNSSTSTAAATVAQHVFGDSTEVKRVYDYLSKTLPAPLADNNTVKNVLAHFNKWMRQHHYGQNISVSLKKYMTSLITSFPPFFPQNPNKKRKSFSPNEHMDDLLETWAYSVEQKMKRGILNKIINPKGRSIFYTSLTYEGVNMRVIAFKADDGMVWICAYGVLEFIIFLEMAFNAIRGDGHEKLRPDVFFWCREHFKLSKRISLARKNNR